jgi:DNA helicase II / ATP-dependent DNA helicase PcrA
MEIQMPVSVAFVAFGKDIATDIQAKLKEARKARNWSTQQKAVFNWVETGQGNAFVEAVAGSGKTTTLVESVYYMTGGDLSQVKAGTVHSFGYGAWRQVAPRVKLDARAKQDRISNEVGIPFHMRGFVFKLVAFAKNNALGLFGNIDDTSAWWAIIDHNDMIESLANPDDADEAIDYAKKALRHGVKIAHEIIDFDDMIYMPVVTGTKVQQYDWVVVDEAQDINPARRALIRKMMKVD